MKTASLLPAAAFLALALSASAHQLWIGANRHLLSAGDASHDSPSATIYVSWGHRLPVDEPPGPARFDGVTLFAPGADPAPLAVATDGYHAATITFDRPGAWWFAAVAKPVFSTRVKKSDGKTAYLQVPRHAVPPGVTLSDSTLILDCAKTLVHVAGPGFDESHLQRRTGQRIELVPLKNPAALAPGESLPLQVWYQGKPYTGDSVEVKAEHAAASHVNGGLWSGETDSRGRIEVPLPAPGIWQLVVIVTEPAEGDLAAETNHIRHRATLTFEVPGEKISG